VVVFLSASFDIHEGHHECRIALINPWREKRARPQKQSDEEMYAQGAGHPSRELSFDRPGGEDRAERKSAGRTGCKTLQGIILCRTFLSADDAAGK
jgi:hypothetical protein